jgi:hypothetical protein
MKIAGFCGVGDSFLGNFLINFIEKFNQILVSDTEQPLNNYSGFHIWIQSVQEIERVSTP